MRRRATSGRRSGPVAGTGHKRRKPHQRRGFQPRRRPIQDLAAEEVGFEPTVPRRGTPVFETGPFNHSGTPPGGSRRDLSDSLGSVHRPSFLEESGEDRPAFVGRNSMYLPNRYNVDVRYSRFVPIRGDVKAEVISFDNPLQGRESTNTVYIATSWSSAS